MDGKEEEDEASDKEILIIDRVTQEINENKEKGKDINDLLMEEVDDMLHEIDLNSTNQLNLNKDAKDPTRTCDNRNFRSIAMKLRTIEEQNEH